MPDKQIQPNQEQIKTPEQSSEQILPQNQIPVSQPAQKTTIPASQPVSQPQPQKPQGQKNPKIKKLCDLAFSDGIDEAIKQAKKTDNAYILDELHDTLIDELRTKLIQAGKLKDN